MRDLAAPFLMPVEGVHTITGIGTVVTGRVSRGRIAVGDALEVVGRTDGAPRAVVITGIESFHREQREARAGENVGLRLRNVDRGDIVRGQVLVAPGSVRPHRQCRAELYLLTAREGGRARPIRAGYRPQLFVGATDVTATLGIDPTGGFAPRPAGEAVGVPTPHLASLDVELPPGGRAEMTLLLDRPVALEPGVRFAVREGGRTIGAGVVTATQ